MIYKMYAIKDELNGYTPWILFLSEELAKRYMKDQYEGNPTIHNTPEHFGIYLMGEFDTETGRCTDYDNKKLVEGASSYGN